MSLNGIGGGDAGSALERFQRIRDSAKKKIEGADRQADIAGLVKRKQMELGAGIAAPARPAASRVGAEGIRPGPDDAAAQAASEGLRSVSAYGRAGGLEKPDPKPRLGRFVDFMA